MYILAALFGNVCDPSGKLGPGFGDVYLSAKRYVSNIQKDFTTDVSYKLSLKSTLKVNKDISYFAFGSGFMEA